MSGRPFERRWLQTTSHVSHPLSSCCINKVLHMFPKLGKGPWALSTQVGGRRQYFGQPGLHALSFCSEYKRAGYCESYWTYRIFSPGNTMKQRVSPESIEYLLPLSSNLSLGNYRWRWPADGILSFRLVKMNTVCSLPIDLPILIYHRSNCSGKLLF